MPFAHQNDKVKTNTLRSKNHNIFKLKYPIFAQLIKYSSSYSHPNCDFSSSNKDLVPHERRCEHRLVPCPDGGCGQAVPLRGLLDHWRDAGGEAIRELGDGCRWEASFSVSFPDQNDIIQGCSTGCNTAPEIQVLRIGLNAVEAAQVVPLCYKVSNVLTGFM